MKFVIEKMQEIKKYTDKTIKIPFSYLIFGVSVLLLCNTKYIAYIDANEWLPLNIRNVVLGIVNMVYGNIGTILIVLGALFVALTLIARYTNIFSVVLPRDIEYIDGTTTSWNEYSATRRILGIILRLMTTWWVYYFLISILFNEHSYAKNFFLLPQSKATYENWGPINELIETNYISFWNLKIMNGLFGLNVVIAIAWILRALFEIKINTEISYIDRGKLNRYIVINDFEKDSGENSVMLLKTKNLRTEKYFLVEGKAESSIRYQSLNGGTSQKIVYNILDSSENLSDIRYHFDALREKSCKHNSNI